MGDQSGPLRRRDPRRGRRTPPLRVGADGTAHLERRIATPAWPDGPPGRLDALALSKGGRYASVRRPAGSFDLWQIAPPRRLLKVPGKKDADAGRSAWTPAGDAVLLETAPERTRLVRLDGRALDLRVAPPWIFSPDGRGVVGGLGKGLALVDLASGQIRRHFATPAEALPPYAFSPDGKLLASAGEDPDWRPPAGGPYTESAYVHDLRIAVWRVADGKRLRNLPGFSSSDYDQAHLFFLGGRRLAAPELGRVFDAPTGRVVRRFAPWVSEGATLDLPPAHDLRPRTVLFPPDPDLGRNVAASPDGKLLVTSESGRETRLLVWDAPNRRLLRRVLIPDLANLRALAFGPDGRLIAEGSEVPRPPDFEGRKEKQRITFGKDGRVLETASLSELPNPNLPKGLLGRTLASDGAFGLGITMEYRVDHTATDLVRFDPKTGARAWTNRDVERSLSPLALSPDGTRFAYAWLPEPLKETKPNFLAVFDAATGKPRVVAPVETDVWRPVFSRDGTRLIVTTSAGIQIRDATTLALLHRVDEAQDSGDVQIAPRPDGGFAAVRRGRDLRLFDREAHLLTTLVSFPVSGWAAWTPGGGAWGSPAGLSRLRRVVGDRLLPLALDELHLDRRSAHQAGKSPEEAERQQEQQERPEGERLLGGRLEHPLSHRPRHTG